MIDVLKEAERLKLPAKSGRELFSRLSKLVGRTVKIDFPERQGYYSISDAHSSVGQLQWLDWKKGGSSVKVFIGRPGSDEESGTQRVRLEAKVSVLTDGQWIVIHTPTRSDDADTSEL